MNAQRTYDKRLEEMEREHQESAEAIRRHRRNLKRRKNSGITCRCFDVQQGEFCKREATHLVGSRRRRSIPLPVCKLHRKSYVNDATTCVIVLP